MSSFLQELRRRNVVRVGLAYIITAWILAQVADLALEAFAAPAWVMKTVLLLMLIGFPLALIFAWAFEKTPEGIKLEKNVDRSQSITPVTGKKLDRGIIVALAIAVVFLLYKVNVQDVPEPASEKQLTSNTQPASFSKPGAASSEPSVAVLPFVNMSNDPANEYFSDGISEELLNVLVKVSTLKVASRTSSFSFKGKDISIPEIAEQLKVDHVLEGSVRKAGNRVRITAQLIEVNTDRHIWSETYDRELEDIFAIQDEISGHIVEALQAALGAGKTATVVDTQKPTENLDAYQAYLQGRYFWQRRGEENITRAIDLFKRAIDLDPDFARAWSSLGAAYITLPTYSDVPEKDVFPLGEKAARRALELDDSQAEAYAVLGDLTRMKMKWLEAESYYQAAIAREPRNPTSHLWYGEFLTQVGRLEDSIKETSIAYDLDPLSPGANVNLAYLNIYTGRYDEANKLLQAAQELGHEGGFWASVLIQVNKRDYEQAFNTVVGLEKKFNIPGGSFSFLFKSLLDGTQAEAAERLMSEEFKDNAEFVFYSLIDLGRLDDAFSYINARFANIQGNQYFDLWDRRLSAFRSDPRFLNLVNRMGLDEYWRQGNWPDLCRPEGETIICR